MIQNKKPRETVIRLPGLVTIGFIIKPPTYVGGFFLGAGDEARTRYLHLGKVALYQMSYARDGTVHYSRVPAFVNPEFSKRRKCVDC